MDYPKPFQQLIAGFRKLPGVGVKTAERYSYQVLNMSEEQLQVFADAILSSHTQLRRCQACGNLAMHDTCDICEDRDRDRQTICVVNEIKDIYAMERTEEYHGLYHVLNGEISPSKGILPSDINITGLLSRVDEHIQEVIIATNPTMDGETTALYLAKLLQPKNVLLTRLAHGLPMGAHLDYADEMTLIKAIEGRKQMKE